MLRCIKTGFHAILPNTSFIYGDAFVLCHSGTRAEELNCGYDDETVLGQDHLLLRICSTSNERPDRIQIRLNSWDNWFDQHTPKVTSPEPDFYAIWQPSSTMLVDMFDWTWFGYEGIAP